VSGSASAVRVLVGALVGVLGAGVLVAGVLAGGVVGPLPEFVSSPHPARIRPAAAASAA
jgi:hypothetical protein